MTIKEAMELLEGLIVENRFSKMILSEQEKDSEWKKVIIRPVKIKESTFMQFEKMKENKSYHFNMEMEAMHEELAISVKHFKSRPMISQSISFIFFK